MNDRWQLALAAALDSSVTAMDPLSGGDFARAWRVRLADGRTVFVKTHPTPPPGFFTSEAAGLAWLRNSSSVNVPDVLAVADDPPFLALHWIEPGRPTDHSDVDFGRELAALHRAPCSACGRRDGRTTGSLALPNTPYDKWSVFYAQNRLLPLVRIAGERGVLPRSVLKKIERLAGMLDDFGGDEAPSLLHGDLWAGNRLIDRSGATWLVDPAAHGGHREFDLGMTRLFGGFSDKFYAAYNEIAPLQAGWQRRVNVHQLAPLLVHAIKFGGHYRTATRDALSRLVN